MLRTNKCQAGAKMTTRALEYDYYRSILNGDAPTMEDAAREDDKAIRRSFYAEPLSTVWHCFCVPSKRSPLQSNMRQLVSGRSV